MKNRFFKFLLLGFHCFAISCSSDDREANQIGTDNQLIIGTWDEVLTCFQENSDCENDLEGGIIFFDDGRVSVKQINGVTESGTYSLENGILKVTTKDEFGDFFEESRVKKLTESELIIEIFNDSDGEIGGFIKVEYKKI